MQEYHFSSIRKYAETYKVKDKDLLMTGCLAAPVIEAFFMQPADP
jgi:hypothetical protein